jgi:hypothetical protein
MEPLELSSEMIVKNLREAIDRLQNDIARVEIWAGALSGYAKPVPGFDNAGTHRLGPRGK